MATVILVENDRDLRTILSGILAEHGFTVLVSTDALGAVAIARGLQHAPDLILFDRRIAQGAEQELVAWMRSFAWIGHVPIVLFTAHGFPVQNACPVETLREAFDADLLLAVVEGICLHSS
ncbi:MAG TPA: response regulator [Myxococcales bacterium]|nr:response regulator [Myxococcales bacterium]